jgi:hypothetical protein
VRKQALAEGKKFKNNMGVSRPAKKIRDHNPKCPKKCFENTTEAERQKLFGDFYKMNSDQKTTFLLGLQSTHKSKSKLGAQTKFSRWELKLENGKKISVCKGAITAIFDVSRNRLSNLKNILKHGDKRGKKKKKFKNATIRRAILKHIKSVPKHKSHYNRKKCPFKSFINKEDIKSVNDMHRLYMKLHLDQEHLHCSLSLYRTIITKYRIGFKQNATDECGTCLKAEREKKTETKKQKRHIMMAKKARNAQKKDVEEADEETFVGERDLKSVTDIPKLSHGEMFYKRALSCYTSIIHNSLSNEAFLFNWTEAEAGRGVNEMIQVRINFISSQHSNFRNFIFWEDNCSSQNKSRFNPVADLFCIQNQLADSISTKFLQNWSLIHAS